jgi:undecaprenyl-diphosphatase
MRFEDRVEVRRIVPMGTILTWLVALTLLPVVFLWFDPYSAYVGPAVSDLPLLDSLMGLSRLLGKFEVQAVLILLVALGLWQLRPNRAASWLRVVSVTVGVEVLVVSLLKVLVRRPRPVINAQAVGADGLLEEIATGRVLSFPSGDTAAAFAIACVAAAYFPRVRVTAMAAACLVGFSRVYFGCHHFSDVVAGALIGTLIAGLILARTRPDRPLPEDRATPSGVPARIPALSALLHLLE